MFSTKKKIELKDGKSRGKFVFEDDERPKNEKIQIYDIMKIKFICNVRYLR